MQKQIDEKGLMASRSGFVVEKGSQKQQQQQQWAVLQCPRCESSNTKFCYYNNYSLSQPRHFCKACKRYWTRGGTLRNVPVGGGCRRKNKRVKKPSCSVRAVTTDGASSSAPSSVSFATNPHPQAQPQITDMSSSTLNHTNIPSFYTLPGTPHNLQFSPSFNSTSLSNMNTLSRFDYLNGFGGVPYTSGLDSAKQTFQDVVSTSNPPLSSYNSIFGSSSCSVTSSTLASLLIHPQKFINGSSHLQQSEQVPIHFQALPPFENQLQMHQQSNTEAGSGMKVKAEGSLKRVQDWNHIPYQMSNQTDQISLSDPSLYWDSTNVSSVWHDPADVGFSVSSLI